MSEKNPNQEKAEAEGDGEKKEKKSPEALANERINVIRDNLEAINAEIRTLEGKIKNRNPQVAKALHRENAELQARMKRLEKALYGLMIDSLRPRSAEHAALQIDSLKTGILDYFKKVDVDENLWKEIESL